MHPPKQLLLRTNIDVDILKCFDLLPITPFTRIIKKRGRKKTNEVKIDPNKDIIPGSIITLKYQTKCKGIDLKKKPNDNKERKGKHFFRNALTIVVILE